MCQYFNIWGRLVGFFGCGAQIFLTPFIIFKMYHPSLISDGLHKYYITEINNLIYVQYYKKNNENEMFNIFIVFVY